MKRITIAPRPDWEKTVEEIGLIYHHTEGQPYWNESAYYSFRSAEIDRMELATNELHDMCLKAAQHIIEHNRFAELGIPVPAISVIKQAWEDEPPALYGRFDLKLLEYNADIPTALLEAAVAQWYWLQDVFPKHDQFNSIHEKLLAKWQELKSYVASAVHFVYLEPPDVENSEDLMTVSYLMDVAAQVGIETVLMRMEDIGWDEPQNSFVDLDGRPMRSIFKLYPWEWLLRDDFTENLLTPYANTHRAHLENAALQQRHSADSLGVVPRPSESARSAFSRARPVGRLRQETAAVARRRESRYPSRGRDRRDRRSLRCRRLRFPKNRAHPEFRRVFSRDRQLADRWYRGGDRHPRIKYSGNQQSKLLCTPSL